MSRDISVDEMLAYLQREFLCCEHCVELASLELDELTGEERFVFDMIYYVQGLRGQMTEKQEAWMRDIYRREKNLNERAEMVRKMRDGQMPRPKIGMARKMPTGINCL